MKLRWFLYTSCFAITPLFSYAFPYSPETPLVQDSLVSFIEDSPHPLVALPVSAKKTSPVITLLTLEPGTLRQNLERINQALPEPWEIQWKIKNDYVVTGAATVVGKDFYEALEKILRYYPVNAVFYTKNHVLSIAPGSAP